MMFSLRVVAPKKACFVDVFCSVGFLAMGIKTDYGTGFATQGAC